MTDIAANSAVAYLLTFFVLLVVSVGVFLILRTIKRSYRRVDLTIVYLSSAISALLTMVAMLILLSASERGSFFAYWNTSLVMLGIYSALGCGVLGLFLPRRSGTPNLDRSEERSKHSASIFRRFAAGSLDVLSLPLFAVSVEMFTFPILELAISPILEPFELSDEHTVTTVRVISGIIVCWLYFSLFESSKSQATPGKMVFGLVVTDMRDRRISLGRASVRFLLAVLFNAPLLFGFLASGFTRSRQSVYDKLTGCKVIQESDKPA